MIANKIIPSVFFILSLPISVSASVVIDEIMYDLPGTDSGREWIEVENDGSSPVDLSVWKFYEADTNHGLTVYQGQASLLAGGFAIIADNPQKFLIDWPNYAGTIFDSSFSLSNTGETVSLKNGDVTIDEVSYSSSLGANGDGNSLQLISGNWKAFAPTPGAANVVSSVSNVQTGNYTTTSSGASSGGNDSSINQNVESQTAVHSSFPTEPQIYSKINSVKSGIVGADIVFEGHGWGLKDEPLDDARYLWNFGDGTTMEGRIVTHHYILPGEYTVVLDVSSGTYESSSRQTMKIVPSGISIADAKSGNGGYVALENASAADLDLSYWFLKTPTVTFMLPKNTLIGAGKKVSFPNEVSGVLDAIKVSLLYPNGTLAASYSNEVKTPSNVTKPVVKVVPAENVALTDKKSGQSKQDTSLLASAVVAVSDSSNISNTKNDAIKELPISEKGNEISGAKPVSEKAPNIFTSKWFLLFMGIIVASIGAFFVGGRGKTVGESGDDNTTKQTKIDGYTIIDVSDEES